MRGSQESSTIKRLAWLLGAAGAFAAGSLGYEPPPDSDVEAAIKSVETRVKGLRPPQLFEERLKAVAYAMGRLPVKDLSLTQLKRLATAGMLAEQTVRPAVMARLEALAADKDGAGAIAAAMRVAVVNEDRIPALKQQHNEVLQAMDEAMRAALAHPGLSEAWKTADPAAMRILSFIRFMKPATLANPAVVDNLERALQPGQNGNVLQGLVTIIDVLSSIEPRPAGDVERLRKASLVVLESVKTTSADEEKLSKLIRSQLEGAYAKGELLGKPAPALLFTVTEAKPAVASIADLKGRVALLVFWHTQGKASMRALPAAEALATGYKDAPVTVLGVTSQRGSATDFEAPGKPQRVDTTGNPKREMELTRQLLTGRKLGTGVPMAFTEEVMNGDYGVCRVPMVVVIDPAGIVRARGSELLDDPAALAKRIEAILTEFKMPAPTAQTPAQAPAAQPSPAGDDDK